MAELLTRRGCPWSKYEESLLLEYDAQGMTVWQIANKLDRTPNAIRIALIKINYVKSQSKMKKLYTPPNTIQAIPVEPPKIIQDDFTTQATIMYQKCMKEGMSIEEATNYLLKNRPVSTIPTIPPTPIKNDCFIV